MSKILDLGLAFSSNIILVYAMYCWLLFRVVIR